MKTRELYDQEKGALCRGGEAKKRRDEALRARSDRSG